MKKPMMYIFHSEVLVNEAFFACLTPDQSSGNTKKTNSSCKENALFMHNNLWIYIRSTVSVSCEVNERIFFAVLSLS